MKKYLFLLVLLLPFSLWGMNYDPTLLQIGAKLFPKVTLMEKGTKERIHSAVSLVIVASESNKAAAEQFKGMIKEQYKNGMGDLRIDIKTISPKEASGIKDAHAFIVLADPEENIAAIVRNAHSEKTLVFVLEPALLQQGADVSIDIGRSVKPYINISTLKQVPFNFEYGFLKLSKFFQN